MGYKGEIQRMKAHLAAHSYEEDLHNLKTDSPTCSSEAMCIVMLTVSVMKWRVRVWISLQHFCLMISWRERYFLDHYLTYIYAQSHRYRS